MQIWAIPQISVQIQTNKRIQGVKNNDRIGRKSNDSLQYKGASIS
jgi:hypothetical protein